MATCHNFIILVNLSLGSYLKGYEQEYLFVFFQINALHGIDLKNYSDLHKWSTDNYDLVTKQKQYTVGI